MSLGSWDPEAAKAGTNFSIDKKVLERFLKISQHQQLQDLAVKLSAEDQQIQAQLMTQDKQSWFDVAEDFNDEELEHLMRFFTLAEKLPGWEAGDKSPVIWLGKTLKKRGRGIDRELLLWIKANSINQYLPHGSLL
jgi:hypothetical protein